MVNQINLIDISKEIGVSTLIRRVKKINSINKSLYDFHLSNADITKANIVLVKIKNNENYIDELYKLV